MLIHLCDITTNYSVQACSRTDKSNNCRVHSKFAPNLYSTAVRWLPQSRWRCRRNVAVSGRRRPDTHCYVHRPAAVGRPTTYHAHGTSKQAGD